jgi:16S rRNA (uracil1498-N3)-methyltransferase
MSHPYFFIDPHSIEGDKIKIGSEDRNHLINVLRSKIGDAVYVSDNADHRYETEILDIKKTEVILLIKDKIRIFIKTPRVSLFQCVLKKNSMELVIQKSTELGVDRIIPVISARVITDKKDISGKTSRWQKISDGASEQSKRDYKCEVLPPEEIHDIMVSDYDLFYIPYEESSCSSENLSDVKNASSIGYVIGPEGGFENSELDFLKQKGAREINFGKNIYRSETAAIYFLSVLDYLTGNQK